MQTPPVPDNEALRQLALERTRLLDTPREACFDRLCRIARASFGARAAFISLIDRERQWFKSTQGVELCETERSTSFCGHAIVSDQIMVVPDALADPRFADNPAVTGELQVRFYAGAPLRSRDGYNLGTLCVVDDRPRDFSTEQQALLRDLADCVEQQIQDEYASSATQGLLDSEERLRTLFDLSPIGIALVDFESGRFLDVNPALVRSTGYSRDRLLTLDHWQLTPEEHRPAKTEALASMARTGHYGPLDIAYLRADGSLYPVRLQGMLLHNKEGRRYVWKLVEDISEHVRVERLQREFIATVSHELRTPLTSLSGALRLLTAGVLGTLPAKADELLWVAQRNSDHLTFLINDILDVEKLAAGKMTLAFRDQPLAPIVEQALADNAPFGEEREVPLLLESTLPELRVDVDHQRLRQALSNLLSNAIKFSPAGSAVTVAVQRRDDRVEIRVTDRGAGVPEAFRERIFQKFAQADATDTRRQGGTGLGLAITRELVERMHGRVGFDSPPGQGASFWIRLPYTEGNGV